MGKKKKKKKKATDNVEADGRHRGVLVVDELHVSTGAGLGGTAAVGVHQVCREEIKVAQRGREQDGLDRPLGVIEPHRAERLAPGHRGIEHREVDRPLSSVGLVGLPAGAADGVAEPPRQLLVCRWPPRWGQPEPVQFGQPLCHHPGRVDRGALHRLGRRERPPL